MVSTPHLQTPHRDGCLGRSLTAVTSRAGVCLSSLAVVPQGAIDLMMTVYKQMLPELGGFLTRGAQVDLARVEKFIRKIGSFEDVIFQKRMRLLSRWVQAG